MSPPKATATSSDLATTADALHSAAIHLLRRVQPEDATSGLSAARLSALSVVVFAGPLSLGRLADIERVRSPTMTGIVNGLERDGLVRRRPDPRDRRAIRVEATARGRRLLDRAHGRRIELLRRALSRLDPDEVALLRRSAGLMERLARQ